MLHKQIVFAAIAVTALMGLIVPLSTVPAAQAQVDTEGIISDAFDSVFGGDDAATDGGGDGGDGGASGEDSQNIDQDASNEADVEQEVEQSADETNTQVNSIETGPNTATVSQSNDDQRVEAAAAAESGDAEAEAEDEDGDHYKHSKDHSSDTDTTTADADSIASAVATATGTQTNTATVDQDSSADDNILVNENEFGDDTQVAVPISDIDQTAENRAINLDLDEEYGQVVDGGDDEEVCPEGFELEEITVNAPGGQRTISVCVEPEEED